MFGAVTNLHQTWRITMSEMVSDDVRKGMDALMNTLLPMIVNKLKELEPRITELEA